jgi:hypothetical protein
MKAVKIVTLVVCTVFIIVQFIRPERNSGGSVEKSIGTTLTLPDSIQKILRNACYDCHSNSTIYPWYANIQPVGWWLGKHIRDGKRQMNFDEFSSYRPLRQYRKLKEVGDQIKSDEMPLPSYRIMHTESRLTAAEKEALLSWTQSLRDILKARFPADSLERRPGRQEPRQTNTERNKEGKPS